MRVYSPMSKISQRAGQQRLVTDRFQAHARNWEDLYDRRDLFSVIHQERHIRALDWIDGLDLPAGARVLEVGPGAGLMTLALAQRGFSVAAADSTPRMVEIARRRAARAGMSAKIGLLLGDANHLSFPDDSFALVVALGVIPWLSSAAVAVAEMTRVLALGGYLVLNADNRYRLNLLLDPRHNPALDPARVAAKSALRSAGVGLPGDRRAAVTAHRLADFDQILAAAGLLPARSCTFGFGPFTMLGFRVFPEQLGVRLNGRLQGLADRGLPVLRRGGDQYLVLARKPADQDGLRA
jgi:ubiquinone/menaquinone biosynthesis C-methylase UbiE